MQNVSKEQWLEWVRHPVTEALKATVSEAIELAKNSVINSYDNPHDYDAYMKGVIKGLNEILEVQPDFSVEENQEDDQV